MDNFTASNRLNQERYAFAPSVEDDDPIDVSLFSNEIGFNLPVLVSADAWSQVIDPTDRPEDSGAFDRLCRVLRVLYRVAKALGARGSIEVNFVLKLPFKGVKTARRVQLKAVCVENDNGEPLLTIFLPGEIRGESLV